MPDKIYLPAELTDADVVSVGGECYERVGAAEVDPTVGSIDDEYANCDSCEGEDPPECDCGDCSFVGTTVTVNVEETGCYYEATDCSGSVVSRYGRRAVGTASLSSVTGRGATWRTFSASSGSLGEAATSCTPAPTPTLSTDFLNVGYNCVTGQWSFLFANNGLADSSEDSASCQGFSKTTVSPCDGDVGLTYTRTVSLVVNGDTECDRDDGGLP